jgi:hypothetical protein
LLLNEFNSDLIKNHEAAVSMLSLLSFIGQFHVATMLGEHTISLNFPIEIVLVWRSLG